MLRVPVILSHRTAWLLGHAPNRRLVLSGETYYGIDDRNLSPGQVGERIRWFLGDCGVPKEELATIDVLSPTASDRVRARGFTAHVYGGKIPPEAVREVIPGLRVVCEGLSYLQAATWMSRFELIEYGYELCGGYELQIPLESGYVERPAPSTVERLLAFAASRGTAKGSTKARNALLRVRNGSRSPMETATAMMIVMDQRSGGLGFRGIEMNHRIDVPKELRGLSLSAYYEIDVYAGNRHFGVEYDGGKHMDKGRRAHDVERLNTLGELGLSVKMITKVQFSEQLALHRALNAIARGLGVKLKPTSDFQQAQNKLRMFAIRTWATKDAGDSGPEGDVAAESGGD